MHINIKIPTRTASILANEARRVSFLDSSIQTVKLLDILTAYIDVTSMGLHSERGDEATFNKKMRVMA